MASVSGDDDSSSAPQQILDDFWENLITKKPGKITNIFPPALYANLLRPSHKPRTHQGRNAAESYQAAADECRARVKHIVRECYRTNEKFTDQDFDIESDHGTGNCLYGLERWYEKKNQGDEDNDGSSSSDSSDEYNPPSVHRIDWIFENPSFTIDGFDSSDVQQGANGDCWFLAAVATICSNPSLMHKVCVERNEECGIYGFVFYRDGEWVWTVVDDNLYLRNADWDAWGDEFDATGKKERKYKKNEQTGSDALYFASCSDQNETWLPLLEKAYAKIHGDYDAIAGGFSGEGVEDMTGGVTTKILTNRVLSKERLWKELLEVNKQFLFSASSPSSYGDDTHSRKGLALGHAYSVIKAVEEEDEDGNKIRLVLIRNPWGMRSWNGVGEWNGAWSDGAKEWTPYWMKKLNYRFGDDGVFWMSFNDLLKRFDLLDRTRLFDKEWTVVQTWTSVSVAWVTGYLNTKFQIEIKKGGPTVFVLAQLDERYFKGLEGKYSFDLHFILHEEGAEAGDHIVRARGAWFGNRSISAEIDLAPGKYEVLPKVIAFKLDDQPDVYDVVKQLADKNPQKLRQIGMNYDIANAKGITKLTEDARKKREQKKKEAEEKKRKEQEEAEKEKAEFEAWKKEKKEREEKEKTEKEEREKAEKEEKQPETKDKETDSEKAKEQKTEEKQPETKDKEINSEKAEEQKTEEKTESANENEKIAEKKQEPKVEETTQKKETEAVDTQKVLAPEEPKKVEEPAVATEEHADKPTEANGADATKEESKPATDSSEHAVRPAGHEGSGVAIGGEPEAPLEFFAEAYVAPVPEPAVAPVPAPAQVDNTMRPWNAVCVLGLRVYSKDPEVSIKLVEPTTAEETAVLDMDGAAPAGATM